MLSTVLQRALLSTISLFTPSADNHIAAQNPAAAQVVPASQHAKNRPFRAKISITKEMGISEAEFAAARAAIAAIENARYDQMGGAGNRFAGKFQMGAAEIRETADLLGEARPTRAMFLHDPDMQERYFEAYTVSHHRYLMRNARYASASASEKLAVLGYAHNQGAGGASKWLNTGIEGRDAFGTSGVRYVKAIHASLAKLQ